jgi:hypothetical protein
MKFLHLSALAIFSFSIAACSPEGSPEGTTGTGSFLKATYTSALGENQAPVDTVESFGQQDPIHISVEIKGRPKMGDATAKFYYFDQLIAETTVDVAEINKDLIFSVGENTFVGFTLKADNPLPVGVGYRTELSFAGKALGDFPFQIAPPKDAIPSSLTAVTLAKGVDDSSLAIDESNEFNQPEPVFLVGKADLGLASSLEVNWLVSGRLDDEGTKSFTMEENKQGVPFYFSFLPAEGWPTGEHEVTLSLNGKEVAREKFTIK